MTVTSRGAVDSLLYLLEEAFEGAKWHSLVGNLSAVTTDDWLWVPPVGRRSIRDLAQHVAGAKLMYHNHAFGDGTLRWVDPEVEGLERLSTKEAAMDWLREGHALWRDTLATLDDSELLRPRNANWGVPKETRWLIATMIEHDLYHAGEINHIRALRQGNDE